MGDRRLLLGGGHGLCEGSLGGAQVDTAQPEQIPGEEGDDECVGAAEAGEVDRDDLLVGEKHAVEDGVVTGGGPHAQRIPGLLDVQPVGVA